MYVSIILAAGEGTRMKSSVPKVLHKVCGEEMIKYVIKASKEANIDKNVLVLGHGKEKIMDAVTSCNVEIAEQPIGDSFPYGTGFAVKQAMKFVENEDTVIILSGDVPLIKGKTLENFIEFHKKGQYSVTILTSDVVNPTGYGRIVRNKKEIIKSIVEHKDASDEEREIKEINSGIYCFDGRKLKETINKLNTNNSQNEYYITDAVKILNDEGFSVGGYKIQDNFEINGINNRVQLAEANNNMKKRINEIHMLNGVTLIDPDSVYIEDSVTIGRDTVIYPGAIIEKSTIIGEDCVIGPNTRIINSTINNGTSIESSKVIDSVIGDNSNIGPFAYLRPGSKIGNNVKIGDFVEVKNSSIGNNSKASHLSYIGDAEVGQNVNIGCGVVFVNYDGKKKHKTIVKDKAFIGSNANLIAPVIIHEGGYVTSGSTITDDVEKEDLAIARARQVNKKGRGKNRF